MVDKMKIVTRSFYYVRIAAGISSFPLTLLTFATVIYYNLVANTVFLKEVFPHFWMFIIVSFICLYVLLGIFGYYWRKKRRNYLDIHSFSLCNFPRTKRDG